MTTLYSSVFLVCGLAYVLAHDMILPRRDSIMTLYDGYYLDYFAVTLQFMYAVMTCPISNTNAGKPHVLGALGARASCGMLRYRIPGSLFRVKVKVTASYP